MAATKRGAYNALASYAEGDSELFESVNELCRRPPTFLGRPQCQILGHPVKTTWTDIIVAPAGATTHGWSPISPFAGIETFGRVHQYQNRNGFRQASSIAEYRGEINQLFAVPFAPQDPVVLQHV